MKNIFSFNEKNMIQSKLTQDSQFYRQKITFINSNLIQVISNKLKIKHSSLYITCHIMNTSYTCRSRTCNTVFGDQQRMYVSEPLFGKYIHSLLYIFFTNFTDFRDLQLSRIQLRLTHKVKALLKPSQDKYKGTSRRVEITHMENRQIFIDNPTSTSFSPIVYQEKHIGIAEY